MRAVRYLAIADALRARLSTAAAGSLLPSEAELSEEFDASRVTVRRALELLRDEGLIGARQGFGWFVAGAPVRQELGTLGTIEAQLEASGRRAERRVLEFEFTRPPRRIAELLGTDMTLRVKRLNLADGEPFAIVTVWCPAELGATLSRRDVEARPFYELIGVELRGASQTIGADSADPADATLWPSPSARRCCDVSGSRPTPAVARCSSARTSSRPAGPSSSSTSPRRRRRPPPAVFASWSRPRRHRTDGGRRPTVPPPSSPASSSVAHAADPLRPERGGPGIRGWRPGCGRRPQRRRRGRHR